MRSRKVLFGKPIWPHFIPSLQGVMAHLWQADMPCLWPQGALLPSQPEALEVQRVLEAVLRESRDDL
jgi:hypothetical protein